MPYLYALVDMTGGSYGGYGPYKLQSWTGFRQILRLAGCRPVYTYIFTYSS